MANIHVRVHTALYILSSSPCPPPTAGKRKKAATSGSSSASSTRSNSVKRETTPVARANITITHSQPVSKPIKPGAIRVKKRPPPTIRRRGGGINLTLSQDLDCNEQIAMDDDNDEDEEEGECSATQCLQPVADQIIWVQCDHCHEWFHCICVGLTKEYAEQIDTYKCASCKQTTSSLPASSTAVTSLSSQSSSSIKTAPQLSTVPLVSSPGQT